MEERRESRAAKKEKRNNELEKKKKKKEEITVAGSQIVSLITPFSGYVSKMLLPLYVM